MGNIKRIVLVDPKKKRRKESVYIIGEKQRREYRLEEYLMERYGKNNWINIRGDMI